MSAVGEEELVEIALTKAGVLSQLGISLGDRASRRLADASEEESTASRSSHGHLAADADLRSPKAAAANWDPYQLQTPSPVQQVKSPLSNVLVLCCLQQMLLQLSSSMSFKKYSIRTSCWMVSSKVFRG